MKKVVLQWLYEIPDRFLYIARNREGLLLGFLHAPVRDYELGEWVDSVTGAYGEPVECTNWETTLKDLTDYKPRRSGGQIMQERAVKNAETYREKRRAAGKIK